MSANYEALPCASCGNDPPWQHEGDDDGGTYWYLTCCGKTGGGPTEDKAILAWNAEQEVSSGDQPKPRSIDEIANAAALAVGALPGTKEELRVIKDAIREAVANETATLRAQLEAERSKVALAEATLRQLGAEAKRLADANASLIAIAERNGALT